MSRRVHAEDEHGHAIDQDNKLIYDPRCYYCLNARDDRELTYVQVEIERAP